MTNKNILLLQLVCLLLCCDEYTSNEGVCTKMSEREVVGSTRCWGVGRCSKRRTEYFIEGECCTGWMSATPGALDCKLVRWQPPVYCVLVMQDACEPCVGIPCGFLRAICVGGMDSCPNGGTCKSPFDCLCTDGYYSPDCEECTQIENCDEHECTNSFNQKCKRCDYWYTDKIRAYKPIDSGRREDRICQEQCSWRSWCYPGTCPDGSTDSCGCASDFGGTNCMTISVKPEITHCLAAIYDDANEKSEVVCTDGNGRQFTNIKPSKFQVDWKTQFKGPERYEVDPEDPDPDLYYIQSFDVGITAVVLDWNLSRGSATILSDRINCNKRLSNSNPNKNLQECDSNGQISTSVQSGDVLALAMKTTNGGRLIIKHYHSSSLFTPKTEYYSGQTRTHTASFVVDLDPPSHCLAACSSHMIDVGPVYTKQATVSIGWSGWIDAVSGINMYEYEVYKLRPYGEVLDYRSDEPLFTGQVTSETTSVPSITLSQPGVYCVLLAVYDDSNEEVLHSNHRLARRFLLYDEVSEVKVSNLTDYQMLVNSAAENTSYQWITNLEEPVQLTWKGHFFNDLHTKNMFLNEIASHSVEIDVDYEVRTGNDPNIRSMEAIPNVNGIVRYDFMYAVDDKGGRTIITPSYTWERLTDFQNESVSWDIDRADGDSVRLWVKAFDVMGNTQTEEVLVNVDTSPPAIEDVGLVRDGEKMLMVHRNTDLFDMILEFDAIDYHSGMKQITWVFKDKRDDTLHGNGSVAVVRTNTEDPSCIPEDCYCIGPEEECFMITYQIIPQFNKLNVPFGDHDFDYVFILTLTNNAMLQTVLEFQITVDTSPPLPGHVFDSEPGNKDIDYQSSLTVHASWNGFFDRESGIKQYKYGIHTSCLSEAHFIKGASPPTEVQTTFDTFTSQTMNTTGKYYTTVVAYNHALEPSHPVCTDGVTIDTTGPVVTSIHVSQAYVKPGLVSDGETMMYMDGEGFVYELTTHTQDCGARTIRNVKAFKSSQFNEPIKPSQTNCSSYQQAGERHYMGKEYMFEMTWEGTDGESTVHDFMVALSSTETSHGDIMPWKSSHGNSYFITYHPNLVDLQEFYVSVKAINKADLYSIETIGPFQMRVSGPTFDGECTLSYQPDNGEYLTGSWPDSVYDDEDINKDYLRSVEYSLGEGSCSGNLVSWTPVTNPANSLGCDNSWPPTCVLIDPHTQGFHLHHNTDYCLSLCLHSYNKLVTSTSVWYSHSKPKPYSGLLWEVDTSTQDLVEKDIDYQTSSGSIHLRFIQPMPVPEAGLQYLVGVGTTPGDDDVKSFSPLEVTGIIEIVDISLQFKQVYYSTVKVVEDDEYILVTSDGLLILPDDSQLEGFNVHDGVLCATDDKTRNGQFGHHYNITDAPGCNTDIVYQMYTTVLSAYWTYSSTDAHVEYFKISVEKQNDSGGGSWQLMDWAVSSTGSSVHLTGLHLEGGETYRLVVQACHPVGCYLPQATDGVLILPAEPVQQDIVSAEYTDAEKSLTVTWKPFTDPYRGLDFSIINQYAISLFVREDFTQHINQITKWIHLKEGDYMVDPVTNIISVIHSLEHRLEASACLVVGVRGYNRAMLSSTAYTQLTGCSVPDRDTRQVIDAVGEYRGHGKTGDISLIANDAWAHPDAEYTKSKSYLAAVWPTLRHGQMQWSVVHGDSVNRLAYMKDNLAHLGYSDFDCNSPEVLACGSTEDRFVNVHHLPLEEGYRYHICIYASAITITNEKWREDLPEISVCTDGITVDTEPPIGGSVLIGDSHNHRYFQSDPLALSVYWSDSLDVEVNERITHPSGIKAYHLAIGSTRGGQDVLEFLNVGLTNVKILTGLVLRNGGTYYVTIKAEDYVGLETSVISDGVTIDTTPPTVSPHQLVVSDHFLTTENSVDISFAGVFNDPESGIANSVWCIGSQETFCDSKDRAVVTEQSLTITSSMAEFVTGQEYFVRLEVYNQVGLSASSTLVSFVYDGSAPTAGYIHEVDGITAVDIDYQVSSNELYIAWGGFSDQESHILEYRLTIGSCQACTDIVDDICVGLVTEYHINHLELKPGIKYFSMIRACNSAGVCTTALSDGITMDGTPPHLGCVRDGLYGEDIDYQAASDLVHVHLENLHDSQSGVSVVSWWVGTDPGAGDVFTEQTAHSHTSLQYTLTTALPNATTIYATVKACNKAGLCTQKTSDGSTVDTTRPMLSDVELIPTTGMLLSNYQVYRNTVALQWVSEEDISPITSTYISLLPQDDAHLVLPTIKLLGNAQSYVISDLDLRDGDEYTAKVTVCNAAKLCEESFSARFTVDSSPPTSGAFAVETEHAVDLSRHREGLMTYNGTLLTLGWVGFQDPHSDVLEYSVKIGTGMYTADITTETFNHQSTDPHRDEGQVVTETISNSRALTAHEEIYISIYATNKAGLQSAILHGLFQAIPSGGDTGILDLERRCSALSCVGHCMCSPHGVHGCDITGSSCADRTGDENYAEVTVSDRTPSMGLDDLSDVDYIPSVHIMQASWSIGETGFPPVWFDWSVGLAEQTPGSGLLDVNTQPLWHEAGTARSAIFSISDSKLTDAMSPHVTYVFHIKAWYDSQSYAIYQSDGVQVDSTAPERSDTRTVTEIQDALSNSDVDFVSSPDTITVNWKDVFRDGQSDLKYFDVMIYSNKLILNIAKGRVDGDVDELQFTGLDLTQGEHYTAVVIACNKAGLCTEASSDGFLLDMTPPEAGSVLDGHGFLDIQFTSDNYQISASWYGFSDEESGIDHHVWCVAVGGVNISCTDVGLEESRKMALPVDAKNGDLLSSSVYAVNGAGLQSALISSNGFIVDQTPPTDRHFFSFGPNIVLNGMFLDNTENWEVTGTQISDNTNGKQCILNGDIQQTVSTEYGHKYRLQFNIENGFQSKQNQSFGYVRFGAMEYHVISAVDDWDNLHLQEKVYFLTAYSSATVLLFGTMTDNVLCIGDIQLEPVTEGSRDIDNTNNPEASFTSSVHVHVRAASTGTSLILNWHFEDLETPIVEYMFAVGTVKGGIQVKDFTSTGRYSSASLTGLQVQHATQLHVTVVATNAAGLSKVVHADPVIVDLTPPEIELFEVNNGTKAVPGTPVLVEWKAKDPESGIKNCDFFIDSHTDPTLDVTALLWAASGTRTITFDGFMDGDELSCKIKCWSYANTYSEKVVGPLIYVTKPPDTEAAHISFMPYSETFHANKRNVISSAEMVGFRWEGILDPVGIEFCQMSISDGISDLLPVVSLGETQHTSVLLTNASTLLQANSTLILSLTCVNNAGYSSKTVTEEFLIDPTVPSYTGEPLVVIWPSETQVQLDWSGLFTSSTPLVYELHLGTTVGGYDVLSWYETTNTEVDVIDISASAVHYLSVSAIGQNGLYATHTFEVVY